jgi:hypothetical protein
MKRQVVLLVCIVLICFICTGCVVYDPTFNNLDTVHFYANIKPDANADYGKKTAVYQDRIYYLSAEDGTQGVYSMRFDGSAVQLEFAAEDIRALAVKDDGFYYSGFSDIDTNSNGEYRCFRLYQRATAQSDPVDLLSAAKRSEDLRDNNVWDFYIATNGVIFIRTADVYWITGTVDLSLAALSDGELLSNTDYELIIEDRDAFEKTRIEQDLIVYQYDEQYTATSIEVGSNEDEINIYGHTNVFLYSATSNKTVLPIDAIFLRTRQRNKTITERWILRLSESKILFGTEAALATYDIATHTGTEISSFPPAESIYATYDTGTDIILLTKEFRSDRWIAKKFRKVFDIPTKKGENLYRADSENGERTRLLSLGQDEAFLYVDDDLAASAAGNIVSLYDIGGETAVPLRTIELEHEIVDSANKVDAAGDWLFLYRFNDVTGRDELLEKVFIG